MSHADRLARRKSIKADIAAGMSCEAVAAKYGFSVPYVKYKIHGSGAPGVSPRVLAIVAELLNTDEACLAIGKRFDLSKQAVHDVLSRAKAAGIKFPNR